MDRYSTVQYLSQLPVTDASPTQPSGLLLLGCCCYRWLYRYRTMSCDAPPNQPRRFQGLCLRERHPNPAHPGFCISRRSSHRSILQRHPDMTWPTLPLDLPLCETRPTATLPPLAAPPCLRMYTLSVTQAYSAPATGQAWATQPPLALIVGARAQLPPGTARQID
jgi:hypothetical protein